MTPRILRTIMEVQQARIHWRDQSVGFVPTMGALHSGHAKLLEVARQENDVVVLSIFVNPTQFNQQSDLQNYPITWEDDVALAQQSGVDFIFAPTFAEMYPDQYRYQVVEKDFSKLLCGQDRPGHFDGVLTVVLKLFNLIQPQKAYFGEKDFQQLQLVRGMVDALFLNIDVVGIPTVRETDGLAKSSRNLRLTSAERALAPEIYLSLTQAKTAPEAVDLLKEKGFIVDYVLDLQGRRFAAARLGQVRLIDNIPRPEAQ